MIPNVALQSTDATSAAPAGAAGETGDTGAFDALLALQSLADADTAAAAHAQLAGALEGAQLLADTLDDATEESADEGMEPGDETPWFLAALMPAPKVPLAVSAAVTAASGTAPDNAGHAAAGAAPLAGAPDTTDALAQAFMSGAAESETGDAPVATFGIGPAAATADTTTWSYLNGPADLFAQSTRQGAERVEAASMTNHVRDPRWADELGNRLASMVRTGESSASLQLTPVDLGPLEVNVSVRDNQATVHFGAANAETRALLEASIPRLREMLAAQGFNLMDSSVSHGFARQTRQESAGTPRVDALGESPSVTAQQIHISGLLDLYA
ncbi:MAG TPA: flagellar hook-length control protein FliK [Steroidobacteraceae bacterium]|nr:flagellar hook-length control protein FliK [Steroidobacteraceae bacterium]